MSPGNGTEAKTLFSYYATEWTDPDLQISYTFGYSSTASMLLCTCGCVLKATSGIGCTSTLPSGIASAGYIVTGIATVYDGLGALATGKQNVTVNPAPVMSASAILQSISTQLLNSKGSVDSTAQVLTLMGTVINKADCSKAPNCTSLNRSPCQVTTHTCGSCFDNYNGDVGDANTLCLDKASLLAAVSSSTSESVIQKQCLDPLCSGKGTCQYTNSDTGKYLSICNVGTSNCAAVCVCFDGYSGISCQVTPAELQAKQKARETLLVELSSLSQDQDLSTDAASSLALTLSQMTFVPSELSPAAVTMVLDVSEAILSSSSSCSSCIASVLSSLDNAATALVSNAKTGRRLLSMFNETSSNSLTVDSSAAKVLSLLSLAASSVEVFPGQQSLDTVYNTFRMSTESVETDHVSLSVPLTSVEALIGKKASSVSFSTPQEFTSAVKVSVIMTTQKS
jgi:hypothetical protein